MIFSQVVRAAARPHRIQRRSFFDWLTKYPDRVSYRIHFNGILQFVLDCRAVLERPGESEQRRMKFWNRFMPIQWSARRMFQRLTGILKKTHGCLFCYFPCTDQWIEEGTPSWRSLSFHLAKASKRQICKRLWSGLMRLWCRSIDCWTLPIGNRKR